MTKRKRATPPADAGNTYTVEYTVTRIRTLRVKAASPEAAVRTARGLASESGFRVRRVTWSPGR